MQIVPTLNLLMCYWSSCFKLQLASISQSHYCAGPGQIGQTFSPTQDPQPSSVDVGTLSNVDIGRGQASPSRPDSASNKTKVKIKFGGMHV